MRVEDIPETEGQGLYLLSFIESAGEVSPVFERKAKNLLEKHDLKDVDEEEFYSMEAILTAFDDVVEEVGENTMRQGGEQMGIDAPLPPEVDTPHGAFEFADVIYKEAHKFDGSVGEDTLAYTYEKLGSQSAHVGLKETYPYPEVMGEGAFMGFVKNVLGENVRVSMDETDPKPDERRAWTLEW